MTKGLEQEVGNLLSEQGLAISIAESSTGGLISHLITSVPGSSNYYKGTVIAYDDEVKIGTLGVNRETLEQYKSVSQQTCDEMAQGVREAMDTDIGLSSRQVNRYEKHIFRGDRLENKQSAAEATLSMLRKYLIELKG